MSLVKNIINRLLEWKVNPPFERGDQVKFFVYVHDAKLSQATGKRYLTGVVLESEPEERVVFYTDEVEEGIFYLPPGTLTLTKGMSRPRVYALLRAGDSLRRKYPRKSS